MANKSILLGCFFIGTLLAIILVIPFIRVAIPGVVTSGVSPMPVLQQTN
jgi:hypothetical protein